ncbi:sperm-associated microtubule inner protein 4 [Cebidichthys violaceus]|uniref:sperm-associated microtubule inner protein 4 n=1 Tax=Cebidichthys violaceus TaxID=271503 RepID=UPI0035CA4603
METTKHDSCNQAPHTTLSLYLVSAQSSSSQMEPKASLNHGIPPDLNGHHHFGYGGTIMTEHTTSHQCYNNTGRKKSKVCLNDQLIPKPTDINMAEKMIKIATPKQHPYSSHISQFALFPSFRSPDDQETGVRAASQCFVNPLIPNNVPDVTLLSKTIGGPYRHEVLETPMKTRKKAVMWTGEHGFLDPLKGENQVFYPTPPKTVLPNPKLRDRDLSLSERTSNMLKNLERTHWVTSYQMHHTGSGPANPLMIDDFKEKICDITGMNTHTVPLRERSFPIFVPSKPRGGCRRRQQGSTCSPTALELPNRSQAPNQGSPSAAINQHRQQEISAEYDEAPDPNHKYHNQSKYSSGSTEVQSTEPSQEVLHRQQTESKSSLYEGRERENCKFQLDQSPMQVSLSQISQEANTARISGTEQPPDMFTSPLSDNREKSLTELCGGNLSSISQFSVVKGLGSIELNAKLPSRAASEQEMQAKGRGLPGSMSNPCILPRPPVLPGIRSVDRVGTVGREGAALCLLDLQNSFSKSKAHREFNCSITRAAVNLRDNVVAGKKHDFYGINCYYLHG